MIFLLNWVMFRFQPLIFRGVHGGPLLVINGVITPRVLEMALQIGNWGYNSIHRRYNSTCNW